MHGHAQGAGALPDEAALAGHGAALAVDDPLARNLSQHRRDLLPHLRGPRRTPRRKPRQVARAHAHQGRELLHGDPPPPRRRPELGLRRPGSGCHRCRSHRSVLLLLCCVALTCARLRAKKKGRPRRTGTALVIWDVLRQGRSGQRPSGSPPGFRAKTSEPPRSLLPVPERAWTPPFSC